MTLEATAGPLNGAVQLPASKSISNRALMIQAMSNEPVLLNNLSEAHDTILLKALLETIRNTSGDLTLDVEDAGTPFRFLTAFLSIQEGRTFLLTGTKRLCERPVNELITALQSIGADIAYYEKDGFAPLLIKGKKLFGGLIQIPGNISSQFISALCLIAPCLQNGLEIDILHQKVSASYIQMTLDIMREFGIQYSAGENNIHIPCQVYQGREYEIENDWSSATFFYSMAMIADKVQVKLTGLKKESSQGDSYIEKIVRHIGIDTIYTCQGLIIQKVSSRHTSHPNEYDLSSQPDLAVPFIVACALKYPAIRITGIDHLELKESRRITALQTELDKINIKLLFSKGVLTFNTHRGNNHSMHISFHTYNDHRIAMALSMLTLAGYTVTLDDTVCVRKSFPSYFTQIHQLGIKCINM